MRSNIKLEGLQDLHKAFEKCADQMFDGLVSAAEKGAFIQLMEMQRKVPVDTGELRKGLGSKLNPKKSNRAVTVDTGVIENPSGKADFFVKAASVEYGHASPGKRGGTKTTPAIPYQRNALDVTKRAVKKVVREELAKVVNRLGSGNGNI